MLFSLLDIADDDLRLEIAKVVTSVPSTEISADEIGDIVDVLMEMRDYLAGNKEDFIAEVLRFLSRKARGPGTPPSFISHDGVFPVSQDWALRRCEDVMGGCEELMGVLGVQMPMVAGRSRSPRTIWSKCESSGKTTWASSTRCDQSLGTAAIPLAIQSGGRSDVCVGVLICPCVCVGDGNFVCQQPTRARRPI